MPAGPEATTPARASVVQKVVATKLQTSTRGLRRKRNMRISSRLCCLHDINNTLMGRLCIGINHNPPGQDGTLPLAAAHPKYFECLLRSMVIY